MTAEPIKKTGHQNRSTSDNPELEFEILKACSRSVFTDNDLERIRSWVCRNPDWTDLVKLARLHGTKNLLTNGLRTACPELIPDVVLENLDRTRKTSATFTVFMLKELSLVSNRLSEAGIRTLVLKGPAIGMLAYRDVHLRPFVDLDLLVPEQEFDKANSVLAEAGYRISGRIARFSRFKHKIYLWKTKQIPLNRGSYIFNLDLHTSIMPPLYAQQFHFDRLWERSKSISVDGDQIRTCGTIDTLRMLCYHGVKNRWEILRYICDVSELVRNHTNIDWSSLETEIYAQRESRIVLLGLLLAHSVFETACPLVGSENAVTDPVVIRTANNVVRNLPLRVNTGTESFRSRLKFQLAIQESLGAKIRYTRVALVRRLLDLVHI